MSSRAAFLRIRSWLWLLTSTPTFSCSPVAAAPHRDPRIQTPKTPATGISRPTQSTGASAGPPTAPATLSMTILVIQTWAAGTTALSMFTTTARMPYSLVASQIRRRHRG